MARVFVGLSVRAALPLVAPLFFGILVVAAILFGPTGMRAADAVATMRSSKTFAASLWFGWFVLALPATRRALVPPSSTYLRWLPVNRVVLYLAAAICALAVQLPWMVLFGRAEGIGSSFSAGFAIVALHAVFLVRPFGILHLLILAGWMLAAFGPSIYVTLPAALASAALATKIAMDRAPEVAAVARPRMRVHSPLLGLVTLHLTYLGRIEPAAVGRAIAISTLAGVILPMAARGHDLELPASYGALTMAISFLALPVGLSAIAAAVIRSERASAWICDCTGTSIKTQTWATAIASSILGAIAGLFLGSTASLMLPPSLLVTARVIFYAVVVGAIVGALLSALTREADASPRRGDRGMANVLVITLVGVLVAALAGESALAILVLLGAVWVFGAPRRAERLRRRRGAS